MEVIIAAEIADAVPATSVELVPLSVCPDVQSRAAANRHDASFIAQLIATAEPQTCARRRGSPADALAAYEPQVTERRSVARRTKQII